MNIQVPGCLANRDSPIQYQPYCFNLELATEPPSRTHAVPPIPKEHLKMVSTEPGTSQVDAKVSHNDFWGFIVSHPASSKMLQRQIYKSIRQEDPGASDEDILTYLIYSRLRAAIESGSDLFELAQFATAKGSERSDKLFVEIVTLIREHHWKSADDVIDAIVKEEEKLPSIPPEPHLLDAVQKASAILTERDS